MEKYLIVKRTGFRITGVADVTMWGCQSNDRSYIVMKPFIVNHLSEIKNGLNDNGFGVQSLNGAVCHIHDYYGEIGHSEFRRTIFVNDVCDWIRDTESVYDIDKCNN
jgi:hypothetical protein